MNVRKRLETLSMPQLRLIVEASKTKSLSRAAENRGVTLSAASRSLKDAEEKLGFVLFERTPMGLFATKQGAIVSENIASALTVLFNEDEGVSSDSGSPGSFSFSFGGSNYAGTSICAPIIAQLSSIWPEVRVNFKTGTTPEIMDMLFEGSIDIACSEEIHEFGRDFKHMNVYIDELCVTCSKSTQLPSNPLDPEYLQSRRWVVPSKAEKSARQAISMFFEDRLGGVPEVVIEGDDPIAMYGLTGIQGYFSFAPLRYSIAFRDRIGVYVLPLVLPNSGRNVSLSYLGANEKAESLKQVSQISADIFLRLVKGDQVETDLRRLKSGAVL